MRVARMYYPVHTLGPGDRMGIWMAGCPHQCEGCISPELREDESGREMSVEEVMAIIRSLPQRPDGFTISGGEPFAQMEELAQLLSELCVLSDDIIVFTGFLLEDLVAMDSARTAEVTARCSVLVDGPYMPTQNDGKGLRGSSNQRFHVFRNHERYARLDEWLRGVQGVRFGEGFLSIGIP